MWRGRRCGNIYKLNFVLDEMVKKGSTKKSERIEALWRILVLVIAGIILGIWVYFIYVLAIFNWLVALFSGKRHRGMADLAEYYNSTLYDFSRYMTGVNNVRPFPFGKVRKISGFEKN